MKVGKRKDFSEETSVGDRISILWSAAGPRTGGEVGVGGGRDAWTNGGEVEEIKTCVNILQLNR